MHYVELAAWVLGAGASAIATFKAPRWSPEWWTGIGLFLCCLALVINHA